MNSLKYYVWYEPARLLRKLFLPVNATCNECGYRGHRSRRGIWCPACYGDESGELIRWDEDTVNAKALRNRRRALGRNAIIVGSDAMPTVMHLNMTDEEFAEYDAALAVEIARARAVLVPRLVGGSPPREASLQETHHRTISRPPKEIRMYSIEVFDPETGQFVLVYESDYAVRVSSNRYSPKVVFETDDAEYNG